MAIPLIENYKIGSGTFPDDNLPFSRKDEKWHLAYVKAILQEYVSDHCAVAYSLRDKFIENKRFAEGTNSEDLYKDIIFEWSRDNQEKKSYTNLDFQIVPVIAQFKSVFLGIMMANQHRITAQSIDPISMSKKLKQKYTAWILKKFQNQLQDIDQNLGIPEDQSQFIPETKTELDIFDQMGAFKLGIENAIEMALDHCLYVSRWNEEIAVQLIGSLFDNNIAACRDYFDPNTYTVKSRFVAEHNLIVQYDTSPTCGKSRYFGEVINYTIADLRRETEGQPGWDEQRIRAIANMYQNFYGNKLVTNWQAQKVGDAYGPFNSGSFYEYDPFIIPVGDFEFASTMYEYDVEKLDAGGNKSFYKTDRDRKYNREDRKSITTPIKVWHKTKIVMGTDYIWDTGLQHDIPRPTFDDARSSFHIIKLPGKSLCERAQPHAKQVQLFYNQLQNHVAKAPPPGLNIEWRALQGVNLFGDQSSSPLELLRIMHQTGDMIYSSTTARGGMINGSNMPPISPKPSGINQDTMVFVNLIEHHIQRIREITGINDKGPMMPQQTATGAKLSFMATDISLRSLYIAYTAVLKETAINAAARLRDLLSYSEKAREIYAPIIGMTSIELLDLVEDLPTANIAIKIEVKLRDEDKDKLYEMVTAGLRPGKNGTPMLKMSEALLIERCIDSGSLKFAQMYLANAEARQTKIDLLKEAQMMKANQEGTQQLQAQKDQNEMNLMNLKTDSQIKIDTNKAQLDEVAAQNDHLRQMELERLKLQAKMAESANPV